ncbi:MAG TPA: WG repeat-containing protein [Pirellulales bacterium]|jgi:hypothetical protein|nr:WG repeat-containing protein [Pirellulales bacterium]
MQNQRHTKVWPFTTRRGRALTAVWLSVIAVFHATASGQSVGVARTRKNQPASDNLLLPFCRGGRWGYIDRLGHERITPKYLRAGDFVAHFAQVSTQEAISFLDRSGTIAFNVPFEPSQLDWVGEFSEERAWFSKGRKCGCLDTRGNVVIEPIYDDARPFREGMARVNRGAIEQAFPFSTQVGGKWGFVTTDGQLVIEPQYEEADDFSAGLALVWNDLQHVFIDRSGKVVLAPTPALARQGISDFDSGFREGRCRIAVRSAGRTSFGFMDRTGEVVVAPTYDWVTDFSDGLARVRRNDKWGFVNRDSREVLPCSYTDAHDFSNGLALVGLRQSECYINKSGRTVVGPKVRLPAASGTPTTAVINDGEKFENGVARVHLGGSFEVTMDGPCRWQGGAWYYLNLKGEVVHLVCKDDDFGPGYGREVR